MQHSCELEIVLPVCRGWWRDAQAIEQCIDPLLELHEMLRVLPPVLFDGPNNIW